ncbi:MAG: M48 family metalloprotease, partial [Candidatus Poribacteria bacterium]
LAHVKNRDTLLSAVAATMAGAITMLASMARWAAIFGGLRGNDDDDGGGGGGGIIGFIFLAILAPIAALLLQLAISRTREYKADRDGATFSGVPLSLAHALRRMESVAQNKPLNAGNPSFSNMFIVNPFKREGLASILSTHPPIQKRIERLEAMAR